MIEIPEEGIRIWMCHVAAETLKDLVPTPAECINYRGGLCEKWGILKNTYTLCDAKPYEIKPVKETNRVETNELGRA